MLKTIGKSENGTANCNGSSTFSQNFINYPPSINSQFSKQHTASMKQSNKKSKQVRQLSRLAYIPTCQSPLGCIASGG